MSIGTRTASMNAAAIYLTGKDDTYRAEDTAPNVHGGKGDDTFTVFSLKGKFYGDAGNDTFLMVYDLGYDSTKNFFNGGGGRDTISFSVVTEVVDGIIANLDKGYATFYGMWETPGVHDRLASMENVTGSEGRDTIVGSRFANELRGNAGNDTIRGLGGNDVIYGDGVDFGGETGGDDRLIGGTGNDVLIGGLGQDILQGDAGKDTFRFQSAFDSVPDFRDTIKDFRPAERDRIDLSAIDADSTLKGDQDFDFIGRAEFSGKAGELNFRFGLLSADVDGDGKADFQVRLMGVKSLADGDFLL